MREQLPLDAVVLSLLADERRAFIAVELLGKKPKTRPQLRHRLNTSFPEVARILAPWPRRTQFITEICDRSLWSLGLTGKVDAIVAALTGPVKGNAWFATKRVDEIEAAINKGVGVDDADLAFYEACLIHSFIT